MNKFGLNRLPSQPKNGERFYVYLISFPDGTPFYVGKGSIYQHSSVPRIFNHEYAARMNRIKNPTVSTIRQILMSGKRPCYQILGFFHSEYDACREEARLIREYSRQYELTNKNVGTENESPLTHRVAAFSLLQKIEQAGLRVEDVCKSAGLQRNTLSKIVHGSRMTFDLNEIKALTDVIGIDVFDFLKNIFKEVTRA